MSVVITLIPLAIAVGVSLSSASITAAMALKGESETAQTFDNLQTIFTNEELLLKTLGEHGLTVKAESQHSYLVETESGTLRYHRTSSEEPFSLQIQGVHNMSALLSSVEELEYGYEKNVQSFTYDKIMCSLAERGMTVESEEIMDDDSILLTLQM